MRTRYLTFLISLLAILALPGTAGAAVTHLVAPGETLTSVAATDGLSVASLAAANGLAPSTELVAGRELVIPPRGNAVPAAAAISTPVAATPAPTATGTYVVRPGDTLSSIAARFGTSVGSLAAANGISAEGVLLAGRPLAVSGGSASSVPAESSASAAAPVRTASTEAPSAEVVTAADVGAAAAQAGVPAALAEAIADQESGFNDAEVSDTGAVGVMQIEPETWGYIHDVLGVPRDGTGAVANVAGGIALLHSLLAETGGDETEAIAAYYQGLRSLRLHGMYADTRQYVASVLALQGRYGR